MSRVTRPLFAIVMFAIASFAQASALQLVAPADGTTLRGGSFAELHWSATQLPPAAEEWEAFLSVDGGKYYAFRVTPHLDIELRRFTFLVPNVDTRDARILIRAGDEAHETHFAPTGSFAIVRDRNAEIAIPRVLQFGRGEAAREGDPDVLSWTEGARDGLGLTQRSSTATPSTSIDVVTASIRDSEPVVVPAANEIDEPIVAVARISAATYDAQKEEPLPQSVDLLLVCSRRNI